MSQLELKEREEKRISRHRRSGLKGDHGNQKIEVESPYVASSRHVASLS